MPLAKMPCGIYSLPQQNTMAVKQRNTGTHVPAARPSTPSVIFTAFTVPTMTNAAKMKYSGSETGT